LVGAPLSTLRWFVPDLTDWVLVNMALSVVLAASRLVLAQRTNTARDLGS
jgi:hypothetical protein